MRHQENLNIAYHSILTCLGLPIHNVITSFVGRQSVSGSNLSLTAFDMLIVACRATKAKSFVVYKATLLAL